MALANIARAKKDIQVHAKAKSKFEVRDQKVNTAMRMISHEDPQERWSLDRFLEEMSYHEGNLEQFQTIDRGTVINMAFKVNTSQIIGIFRDISAKKY